MSRAAHVDDDLLRRLALGHLLLQTCFGRRLVPRLAPTVGGDTHRADHKKRCGASAWGGRCPLNTLPEEAASDGGGGGGEEEAGGGGGPLCGLALPLPPPRGAEQEELGFSGAQVVGVWAGSFGEEAGKKKASRGPGRGAQGGRGKYTPPLLGLDTQTLGLWTRPPLTPRRRVSAQSQRTARVRGARARAHTHTGHPPALPDRAESREPPASPRWWQRSSNKFSERLPGPGRRSHGSRSSAGPGCLRSTRGGGGGMWPLPPIHKSSAGLRRRAGLSGARRLGGLGLRRARRPQENKRARRSEPPVLRPPLGSGWERRWAGAAQRGPCWGGGASDGASCAAPSLGGGAAPGRGVLGSGGRAAKDTCRLPRLRRSGASAQRPSAGLLRSGGAGSHAIRASAHLRAGCRPWLATGGGRKVA